MLPKYQQSKTGKGENVLEVVWSFGVPLFYLPLFLILYDVR